MAIRVTVTRGISAAGAARLVNMRPTVIVSVDLMPLFPAAVYEAGLTAQVVSGRRNARFITVGLKTLSYTDAIAGTVEARRAGADEALFLDTEAHCCEAAASNLFIWTGRALVTPPLSFGPLPGITRATVVDLAGSLACRQRSAPSI